MTANARVALLAVVLLALSTVPLGAQNPVIIQKPTEPQAAQATAKDTQAKPADVKPEAAQAEVPADFKAFNDAGKEKDLLKRIEAYEKFIADHPTSRLVATARNQIQSSLLSTLKTAQAKYLDVIKTQIENAKTSASGSGTTGMLYSTYSRVASELLSAGVLLDRAEEHARTALSSMDEQKYVQDRKQAAERTAEAFAKRAAAPPAAAPATPPPPSSGGYTISMVDGAPFAKPAPPRPATATPSTPPLPPRMPSDEELRTAFRSERASVQATLGQILLKRGKTAEGEMVLKEAYAAKPASYTLVTIARVLAGSAKTAGDDRGQLEYLTTLALSGRITKDEQKDFEAVYRKTNSGSLDGLEEMLDARYLRNVTKFEVKPSPRKVKPADRAVLAEMFTGAG